MMKGRSLGILMGIFLLFSCSNPESAKERNADNPAVEAENAEMKTILFFGNSLTAGYGLDDKEEAFPGLIQKKIDSLELPYKVINGGLSGETSAGGNERVEWLLKQPIDIFVLELGANDGLRGLPVADTYKNLRSIINKVRTAWPDCQILLTGMMVPPSMGKTYAEGFNAIFPKLAEDSQTVLVPFLLENVAGETALNQKDGVHPTKEGQLILAENVWSVLETML